MMNEISLPRHDGHECLQTSCGRRVLVKCIIRSKYCPGGGTGRRAGLKNPFSQESESSTLSLGTIYLWHINLSFFAVGFHLDRYFAVSITHILTAISTSIARDINICTTAQNIFISDCGRPVFGRFG